jgi:hypothetical protein
MLQMMKAVLAVTAASCLETGLKGSVLQGGDSLKAAVQAAQFNETWPVHAAGQAGRELQFFGGVTKGLSSAVSVFVATMAT